MVDYAVRAKANRVFLELIGADLLDIFLWDNPRSAGRGRGIEGHKIGPGFMQMEANMMRINDLYGLDFGLQQRVARSFIALEAELHILCRKGIAVMKRDTLTQLKIIGEPIWALLPLGR